LKKELVGKKIGMLTIVAESAHDPSYGKYSGERLIAQCECGKIKSVNRQAVLKGSVKSCGCLVAIKATRHGLSYEKLYRVHKSMIQRCYNSSHWLYPRYGGRGICVCENWRDNIKSFIEWAKANGYENTLTIDRIDNDGNYEPKNCRFVTKKENMNNTSKTIFLEINGVKISLQDAASKYNIDQTVIYQRLKKLKWTMEDCVFKPVKKLRRRTA